jgi:ferredoxin
MTLGTGSVPGRLRAELRRPLAAADAVANRIYGWRCNPLYQSGTLAVLAFLVMLVTGVILLLFYRIGSPYESVARIEREIPGGSWLRALHRYAADLAVAAGALHAFRMFAQGRSFGPRALAWLSGLGLLFLILVCGWTGYVMVWDTLGQLLAVEGARLLDALPIFSEPLARAFVGDRPIPGAFFFLNLFAHIAFPIGLALLLWIHVSRLARPVLLPPRPLLAAALLALSAGALLVPAPLGPEADLQALPGEVPLDAFYAFWLPVSRRLDPAIAWAGLGAGALLLCLVPLWTRPAAGAAPDPADVDPRLCTDCGQCALDCPWEAIAMLPVPELRPGKAAHVDPGLCVSCGICAGSCAPMAMGPPRRRGRDQLAAARAFFGERSVGPSDVVLVACRRGAGRLAARSEVDGAPILGVECGGSLHTSAIELLIRSGVGGVLLAACPPRDCWHREGPRWLEERLHHGREAELQPRVDRSRLRLVYAGEGEGRRVRRALTAFREEVRARERARSEAQIELETECQPGSTGAAP